MQSQKDKGVVEATPSQSSKLSATQESMESENKERGTTITSYFRTGKRGPQDMESDTREGEEVVNKRRRRSRLEILSGYVNDVLMSSSEIIDVSMDGPQFLDHD